MDIITPAVIGAVVGPIATELIRRLSYSKEKENLWRDSLVSDICYTLDELECYVENEHDRDEPCSINNRIISRLHFSNKLISQLFTKYPASKRQCLEIWKKVSESITLEDFNSTQDQSREKLRETSIFIVDLKHEVKCLRRRMRHSLLL